MAKIVNQEAKFGADENQPFWMLASLNVDKVEAIAECVRTNIAGHFGIDENEGFWNLAAIEIEISDLIAEQKSNVGNNTPKKTVGKNNYVNFEDVSTEVSESSGGGGRGCGEEYFLANMTNI